MDKNAKIVRIYVDLSAYIQLPVFTWHVK